MAPFLFVKFCPKNVCFSDKNLQLETDHIHEKLTREILV